MKKILVAFDPHLSNINQAYEMFFAQDDEIDWRLLSKPRWSEGNNLLVAIRAIYFLLKSFFTFAVGKYDLIHANGANLGIAAYCASFFRAKYIYTIHGCPHPALEKGEGIFKSFLAWLGERLMKIVVKRAVGVYAITEFTQDELKRYYGISSKVIYNGISLESMHRVQNIKIRERYGLLDREIFISVGRMIPYKDPRAVIEMFSHIRKSLSKAYLIFIGDGELWEETVRFSQRKGLQNDILFLKTVPFSEMCEWYSCATYFISGCEVEGFGLAALEAASCGCIPVLPNGGSFPEIFVHDKYLYDKKNIESYVLPSYSDENLAYLSSIVKKFSWDNALNEYREEYLRLARQF